MLGSIWKYSKHNDLKKSQVRIIVKSSLRLYRLSVNFKPLPYPEKKRYVYMKVCPNAWIMFGGNR